LQFIFCENSGNNSILLKGELYNYIFKVRRHKSDEVLNFRNPNSPKIIYRYSVESIDRRKAKLKLESSFEDFIEPEKKITLGWCVVDIKTIEKTLPMINELGVQTIHFIYCKYSQKDIKLDFERLNKILQNSSMQSGRYDITKLSLSDSLDSFLENFPKTIAIDFSDEKLGEIDKNHISILIGAEGGFSQDEREKFKTVKGLKSPYILKSQTAVISAISLI